MGRLWHWKEFIVYDNDWSRFLYHAPGYRIQFSIIVHLLHEKLLHVTN